MRNLLLIIDCQKASKIDIIIKIINLKYEPTNPAKKSI